MNKISLMLLLALVILFLPGGSLVQAQDQHSYEPVRVYFFWGDGCPHCATQKFFLEQLSQRYPQVEIFSFEVWYLEENRPLFFAMAGLHGMEPQAVPTTFIGDRVWVGFNEQMGLDMEAVVANCIAAGCPDPGKGILFPAEEQQLPEVIEPSEPEVAAEPDAIAAPENVIDIPLIGAINLDAQSLAFSTALIAFVDGFNPCSLWVLSLLLALVIYTGSRKKIFLVGFTFLLVTASVYGLFIVGLFGVFTIVSFMGWIQVLVALIAMAFALVNIKDYFWYKEGLSFTISDKHKPKIYQDIRSLMKPGKSTLALIGSTIVMAMGIALVELPCTAGFPVLWSNLIASHNVGAVTFALLLGLYMLIYLLDELVVFASVVFTLRASKFEEKHGRVLKLVGGMVMLALAVVLLVNPELMNDLGSSLSVFGVAFAATLLVLLLHRKVLPLFGVVIGTELVNERARKRGTQ